MADIHIEEFYRDTAVALVQLYRVFPRRMSLFVEDIAGPDQTDEFGLHSDRHMACFGGLLWLAEEGLIRYVDTIRQEALDQAILTHKAFTRLCAPASAAALAAFTPEALARSDALPPSVRAHLGSHISLIQGVLRSGSSTQIGQVMKAVFFTEPDKR
ncbi:hypothetical protein [Marinobacter sp. X15-166B]|uniref:hypothetical protein n=1 Tax=Marinobacter sp. X15-166B TaxID=1897620 RepID=UPI00085CB150|nr:hypothetical protein [Marinobacter sp. X15-166B]OEY67195.1 hypothetical protein BG841_12550 [Marinobacter sp. X15-166B]